MKSLFDGFDHEQHAEEAEQRWGHSDAYRVRAPDKQYGTAEWDAIARGDAVFAGSPSYARWRAGDDPRVGAAVRAPRHITRWFYPCSVEIQRGLAEMFVADSAVRGEHRSGRAGLARYVRDAIVGEPEELRRDPEVAG